MTITEIYDDYIRNLEEWLRNHPRFQHRIGERTAEYEESLRKTKDNGK